MNVFIKQITLFSENEEKKHVPLDSGLNIITGDSKTGKSALIEIVDYCFFSSRSTIPKGKIRNFTDLYCLVLKVEKKYLVIARPRWENKDNTLNSDRKKSYFSLESDSSFLDKFNFNYFQNKTLKNYKEVQIEVERHLGLSVSDTRKSNYEDKRSAGKATMRSFVSFLFQHQNLIANKHSLFYRFDDYQKRKTTIDQFPILMGWADGNFYKLKQRLEAKKVELRKERRRLKSLKLTSDEKIKKLLFPIKAFYSSIGYEWDETEKVTLTKVKKLAKNLPEIPKTSYANSDLELQIKKLKRKRTSIRRKLQETKGLIDQLDNNGDEVNKYYHSVKHITHLIDTKVEDVKCPICDQHVANIEEKVETALESQEKLLVELSKISGYKKDNSEHLNQLINNKNTFKEEIKNINKEIFILERPIENIKADNSLRDNLLIQKGRIEEIVSQIFEQSSYKEEKSNVDKIRSEIEDIEERLKNYSSVNKLEKANVFLSENMTRLSKKLDFEEELQPGIMRFNLKTFDFEYEIEKEKQTIILSEMGSGANWLACHLALFLSLLHLSCIEKESCIPTFLFIDQPSQVYFPKTSKVINNGDEDFDENIKQVKKIFKVILAEIDLIKNKCGFSPQVIVMEHADEDEFDLYVKKRWSTNGEKLI